MTPSPPPELTPARLAEIRARFKVFESVPHRNNATDCAYIDDVGDLLAEIDRLQSERHERRQMRDPDLTANDPLGQQVWNLRNECDRLRDALAGKVWEPTLEAALRSYGKHGHKCSQQPWITDNSEPCSCGFSALLDRLRPQEPANG